VFGRASIEVGGKALEKAVPKELIGYWQECTATWMESIDFVNMCTWLPEIDGSTVKSDVKLQAKMVVAQLIIKERAKHVYARLI
jgi:hypothetical protein